MYRICRKIPDSFQGDFGIFVKKWYILKEFLPILWLISWSLPDDEGGITCMLKAQLSLSIVAQHAQLQNTLILLTDWSLPSSE